MLARFRWLLALTGWLLAPASPDASQARIESGIRAVYAGEPGTAKPLWQGEGHTRPVARLAFSPDAKTLIAAGEDGTIGLWDAATGNGLRTWTANHPAGGGLALSPDGKLLASVQGPRVWEVATGKELFTAKGSPEDAQVATFTSDGQTLAVAGKDGVGLWAVPTGKERSRFSKDLGGGVTAVGFSPDGKRLAFGGRFGIVHPWSQISLWDTAGGKEFRTWNEKVEIDALAFSPNGQVLASLCGGGEISLRDVATGNELRRWPSPPQKRTAQNRLQALALSPNGRILATGANDGTIQLWELATGKDVVSVKGHGKGVVSLAFSPDGRRLASGSADATVRLWDVAGLWRGTDPVGPLTAKEMAALWTDLAQENTAQAYRAMGTLIAGTRETPPFLRARLQEVLARFQAIDRRIGELDDDQYEVREKATRELEALGRGTEGNLRAALAKSPSPEVRHRLEHLLAKLNEHGHQPALAQALRAVETLEYMGTPEARQVLEWLAKEKSAGLLTEEARAALDRWARRSVPGP